MMGRGPAQKEGPLKSGDPEPTHVQRKKRNCWVSDDPLRIGDPVKKSEPSEVTNSSGCLNLAGSANFVSHDHQCGIGRLLVVVKRYKFNGLSLFQFYSSSIVGEIPEMGNLNDAEIRD
jgi:hypothetical protein